MKKVKVKPGKCAHDYVLIDKWSDAERIYWEFYCRYCLEIVTRTDKHRRIE